MDAIHVVQAADFLAKFYDEPMAIVVHDGELKAVRLSRVRGRKVLEVVRPVGGICE